MKDILIDIKQSYLFILTLVVGITLSIAGYTTYVYGHNFAGDESASFLALLDQMQIEMHLANSNLMANNQSLAKDHFNQLNELYTEDIKKEISEKNERIANEISSIINDTGTTIVNEQKTNIDDLVKNFNDVSTEAISVRIDPEDITNSTIQALHFANLINAIDNAYATAFDTKPMNMSGMNTGSDMDMDMSHGGDNMNMSGMNTGSDMDIDMSHGGDKMEISNLASYQTAKELTTTALDLFNSAIKDHAPVNATEGTNVIETGLVQLTEVINSKNPYNDAMGIIHGTIHTNTQELFGLPIK